MKWYIPPPTTIPTRMLHDEKGTPIGLVAVDGSKRVYTLAGNPSRALTKSGSRSKNHIKRAKAAKRLLYGSKN